MFVLRLLHRVPSGWAIAVTMGAILVAGCGSDGYSGPTGTVSGAVTLGGEAVAEGCPVTFISDEGFTAVGVVGEGGNYQLSAGDTGDQIPVATYKVMVSDPPGPEMSEADYDKMMEEPAGEDADASSDEASGAVIPVKYQLTSTSELSFEVKEGPNTINIPLE